MSAFEMPQLLVKPAIALAGALTVVALLYTSYHWVDPLPPHRFSIAAGAPGSVYDNFARQYAAILARDGVNLEIRNTAGAVEGLQLLRNPSTGVQAALATFDSQPDDADMHYSLGGVFDAVIFIFYRSREPVSRFTQLRGKRLAIGQPGTALRAPLP
ncbi:MAG TPA: hypothetical protein VMR43_06740, partial [Variovorax sp.]|nr:hypothetical protein [Variovorax sp.]